MKKYMAILIITAVFGLFGQKNMGAIKAGMFFPQACDGGFDLGFEYGFHIDTNLDIAMSLDWFKKEFTDKSYIGDVEQYDNSIVGTQYRDLGKITIYDFPLMVAVTAKFPLGNKLKWFAIGGLGAEMLYASLETYDSNDGAEIETKEESTFAFDFNWRLGGGVMYNLGQKSEVFCEAAYHYSKPSFDDDNDITTEYDMSGIMSRVGVRFFF